MTYKYDKILIIRAIACLMVFFSHIQSPKSSVFLNIFLLGDGVSAVRIFFILSGYLIGKNYFNNKYDFTAKSLKRFYLNRIKRIAPLYYFVVFWLFVLIYPVLWSWQNWYKILGILTFTFDYDAKPYFTGGLWSLSVEMQFYLIAPILVWVIFKVCKSIKSTILVIFLSIFISIFSNFLFARGVVTAPNQVRHFLIHFFCFPVGIALNPLFYNLNKYLDNKYQNIKNYITKNSNILFFICLTCTIFALSLNQYFSLFINPKLASLQIYLIGFTGLLVIFTSILIYFAEQNSTQIRQIDIKRLFKNPLTFLEILGTLSYGFYLWHGDVLFFLKSKVFDSSYQNYFQVLSLGFLISLLLALSTYFGVEKILWKALQK